MDIENHQLNISLTSRVLKRTLDLFCALFGLLAFGWIIFIAWVVMSINTRQQGFFTQDRIGRHGNVFRVIKIRTMRISESFQTTVTTKNDPRITKLGGLIRHCKIDELPQLVNVLFGDMSIVGPRPDVVGFADRLSGKNRVVLNLRPGITGVASLAFKNEESLLSGQGNPEKYNTEVIYPEKTRLNMIYLERYSIFRDLGYILETITGIVFVKNDGR